MVLNQIVSFLGILVMFGIAYSLSVNRKAVKWHPIFFGLLLQFVFTLLVLKTTPGLLFFKWVNDVVIGLLNFTAKGSSFVFGGLVSDTKSFGFIFAFQVLPTIIFFSALMSILYYLGIMQKVVEFVARIIISVMGTSGAETLCTSANIFVGQTEAPLLIRPYIDKMTRSELLVVMTGGFATMAAGVIAAYVGMLKDTFPNIAGHLLTASIISAPGAIMMAKIMIPETEEPATKGTVKVEITRTDANIIDAAANGASMGVQLAINVGGMLLAFIALIAMCNAGLEWIGNAINGIFSTQISLNLETIIGTIFSPIAWIMGVAWKDCTVIGSLLGKMLVINEFVAYSELGNMLRGTTCQLDPRSVVIAVYALCGFANFSSIAIQIGGIGGMAPIKKAELAKLGPYGLIAGLLTCYQTAAIAGLLVPTETLVHSKENAQIPTKKVVRYQVLPGREEALRRFGEGMIYRIESGKPHDVENIGRQHKNYSDVSQRAKSIRTDVQNISYFGYLHSDIRLMPLCCFSTNFRRLPIVLYPNCKLQCLSS